MNYYNTQLITVALVPTQICKYYADSRLRILSAILDYYATIKNIVINNQKKSLVIHMKSLVQ